MKMKKIIFITHDYVCLELQPIHSLLKSKSDALIDSNKIRIRNGLKNTWYFFWTCETLETSFVNRINGKATEIKIVSAWTFYGNANDMKKHSTKYNVLIRYFNSRHKKIIAKDTVSKKTNNNRSDWFLTNFW